MPIRAAHCFLITPARHGEDQPDISATDIELTGKLFGILSDIYDKSEVECSIEISFNNAADGKQQNPARDLLVDYVRKPDQARGRLLAARLQSVTTLRSGLGLLFLLNGMEGVEHKVMISRFPADTGVWAEAKKSKLNVQLLERVFMKNATSYKAALYRDPSMRNGFWDGRCIDKQVNSRITDVSEYWIKDFLDSDFKLTSKAGSKQLAVAIKDAANAAKALSVKQEIVALAQLLPSQDHKMVSPRSIVQRFGLSEEAEKIVSDHLRHLYTKRFRFDATEFKTHVPYQAVELDSGAILIADAARFNEIFAQTESRNGTRYSTEGKIVDEKLKRTKT